MTNGTALERAFRRKKSGNSQDTGNDTQDYVFLLSFTDIKKYWPKESESSYADSSCKELMLHPTDYAVAQGAYVNIFDNTEGDDFKRVDAGYNIYDDNSSCNWWLRTLGGPSIIIDGVNHNYYSPVVDVKHFFTPYGKKSFTLFGKHFFTLFGNEFFTSYGNQFFTLHGKEFFTSLSGSRPCRRVPC